ncbi:MAG TPA: DEAD/DEAH box helicase [Candidatus Bathyarchaeia archaeon]|nr:DEAD/DEAH box helicase [Candidatus Bathyarchaeia archaeon]
MRTRPSIERRAELQRVIVDRSLVIRPPSHIPEPTFGLLTDIMPFHDGAFRHPATLNPEIAKDAFLEAGFKLVYSREARKIIHEHRSVLFEYDPAGYVWVKSQKDDPLKEIFDDRTFKTYLIWSPYYDCYRLRQVGSITFLLRFLKEQDVEVTLKGFPQDQTSLASLSISRKPNVKLYPFQQRAVEFVLENDGRACIFDEMGLGKTISATAALIELVAARKARRAIIVAPNAVLEQWRDEMVEKFNLYPTLVTSRRRLEERIRLYEDPLVVINYELLRTDVELILKKTFDTLILDEVTRVKNWDTQTSEAVKRILVRNVIALTGTPLENHIGELYNIVNIVHPGFFGRYHEDFLARYTTRSSGLGWQTNHPSINPYTLTELREKLAKVSIRRTKSDVFKQLPSLTMEYVYTEPARNQKMIYEILETSLGETLIDEYTYSLNDVDGPNPFTANRLRFYTLLREACADISMIAGYLRRKQRENTRDAHLLRQSPIFNRLTRTLTKLEPENAKLSELKELVKDLAEQGHKIIVFSQFVAVIKLVQDELENDGISCVAYHGQISNEERSLNLKRFTEQANVTVLASTDAGQFGLNLQIADVIINYDLPWNPARLQQRIARIHRIGQVNKVLAINFVVKGTVEEHVREILEKKRKVFRDVTVSDLTESENFGMEELRELFGFDMKKLAANIQHRYGIRMETTHGRS